MSPEPQHVPMFRIDVSADASSGHLDDELDTGDLIVALLRQVVAHQEQQNHLLKELNHQLSAAQRQRATELEFHSMTTSCWAATGSWISMRGAPY